MTQEIFGIVREYRNDPAPIDPGALKRWAENYQSPVHYLTKFEVLRVEEVQDELLLKAGRSRLLIFFRPTLSISGLELRKGSIFQIGVWRSGQETFERLFPIHGSEYAGFGDERIGQIGWRSQMDGTLYASLDAAQADRDNRYRGVAVVEALG